MEEKLLRIVYTVFLGIILALFVGIGISTFYPGPESPDYSNTVPYKENPTPEQEAQQAQFDKDLKTYGEKQEKYSGEVAIISLVSSVILLAVSFIFEKKNRVVANGVLLGAVFTLLYSVGRGFASQNSKLSFLTVSVALALAVYLGYRRFAASGDAPKGKLVNKKKRS